MIHLTRSVMVSSFDVEAKVALGRDRPEFLAVARLAADLGRPIGAIDVLRELLGPRRELLGWRVIERCVDLGLLVRTGKDGDATLSDSGRLALEHGEVLVPEEGAWRFFVIDDPLVPCALVHVQHLETDPVKKERDAVKDARARGERHPVTSRTPEILRRCEGALPRVSVQNGHIFQLDRITENGATGPSAELRLTFSWNAEPAIHVSGRLPLSGDNPDAKPVDADLPIPEVIARWNHQGLWRALISHATGVPAPELERWHITAGKPVVPATFAQLPPAARLSYRNDVEVPASELSELGRFHPTTLKGVELVPAQETDAQDWLHWLQWECINDYVTPTMLEQQGPEARARFPHHRPRALNATELLDKARALRDERAWFLLGPSDLGLWSSS